MHEQVRYSVGWHVGERLDECWNELLSEELLSINVKLWINNTYVVGESMSYRSSLRINAQRSKRIRWGGKEGIGGVSAGREWRSEGVDEGCWISEGAGQGSTHPADAVHVWFVISLTKTCGAGCCLLEGNEDPVCRTRSSFPPSLPSPPPNPTRGRIKLMLSEFV